MFKKLSEDIVSRVVRGLSGNCLNEFQGIPTCPYSKSRQETVQGSCQGIVRRLSSVGRQVTIRALFRELLGDCQGVLLRRSLGRCQGVFQSCHGIVMGRIASVVSALFRELSEDCQGALLGGSSKDC